MESHLSSNLATLSATLASIADLHSSSNVTDSKSNLQPFTSAILNSYNLDITSFIRDAEPLEENLFWIPPKPGSGNAAAAEKDNQKSSRIEDSRQNNQVPVDEDLGVNVLMPRNPERRQPVPPTPLRQANRPDGRPSNIAEQYGARTLLLAAQKLVDNYIPTPRARKHIKQLLKRQSELHSSFSKLDRHAAVLEEAISRGGRAPSDGSSSNQPNNQSIGASSKSRAEEQEELKRIREELQKEEMEVMALEEMEKELEREIRKNKAAAAAGSKASSTVKKPAAEGSSGRPSASSRPSVGTRPASSRTTASSSSPSSNTNTNTSKRVSSGSASTSRRSISGSTTATPKARGSIQSEDTTPKKRLPQQKEAKAPAGSKVSTSSPRRGGDETKEEEQVSAASQDQEAQDKSGESPAAATQEPEEAEEATVRMAPPAEEEPEENLLDENLPEEPDQAQGAKKEVDPYASPYTLPVPKPTDELERITELIWNTFPDLLRSSPLPNSSTKEGADFEETIAMIDSLANPPPSNQSGGDVSMSEDGTVITTSSTSSTASSSAFGPPAPHTPTNTIFCLILSSLLRSEEPHQVEFPFLKQLSELWWKREGKEIFIKAYPPNVREEDVNLDESGTAMATRAVYSMAGKKLAFPKRARDGSHRVLFGTGLQ